jgi:gluconokinase
MGVSGSGKTTIAGPLAARLDYAFADADDFHPSANVAKMQRGEPLAEGDREPWLASLAAWIAAQDRAGRSTVLACSALRRRHRDTLRGGAPGRVRFVHLTASEAALRERLQRRQGHYMPPELLDSQLATLEPLEPDEHGVQLDATAAPATVVENVLKNLALSH